MEEAIKRAKIQGEDICQVIMGQVAKIHNKSRLDFITNILILGPHHGGWAESCQASGINSKTPTGYTRLHPKYGLRIRSKVFTVNKGHIPK